MCMNVTKLYKDVILHIDALGVVFMDAEDTDNNGTTWNFDFVQPIDLGFFSAVNIYDHDLYRFPPATSIQSVHGSRGEANSLVIRARSLAPSAPYTFRANLYSAAFVVMTSTSYISTISTL